MIADSLGAPGFSRSIEVRAQHRNGHWRYMEVVGNAVLDPQGVPTIIVNARDLTERQRLQAELRGMSVTDDLTGLNNRRGFFMLAEQEMKLARRLKKDLLLVFVDLDDFKSINDTHGHQVGDQALAETAEILRTTFRESDVLALLGGEITEEPCSIPYDLEGRFLKRRVVVEVLVHLLVELPPKETYARLR